MNLYIEKFLYFYVLILSEVSIGGFSDTHPSFQIDFPSNISRCYGDYCFHYRGKSKINFASLICQQENEILLEIKNEKIENYFKTFKNDLNEKLRGETWMRINWGDSKFRWLTSGNEIKIHNDLNDVYYSLGSLKVNGAYQFLSQKYSYKLSDFICEFKKIKKLCIEKGEKIDKKCFVLFENETLKTWFEAENECVKLGGSLAEFDKGHSPLDLKKVKSHRYYWIGLRKLSNVWPSDEQPVLYSNWIEGYVGGVEKPDPECVYLLENLKWKTKNCHGFKNVVCVSDNNNNNNNKKNNGILSF